MIEIIIPILLLSSFEIRNEATDNFFKNNLQDIKGNSSMPKKYIEKMEKITF